MTDASIPFQKLAYAARSNPVSQLAYSTTATVAFSVFVGLSSGTTTLVSQAIGAGDSEQVAYWLHRAVLAHLAMLIPLGTLLTFLAPLLRLMGQEPEIAADAGSFGLCLLPAVFAWSLLWVVIPWLQAQGVVKPQLLAAALIAVLHPVFLWLLVHVGNLGYLGAALGSSLSLLSNLLLVVAAVFCCARRLGVVPLRRPGRLSCARLPTFLRLALPGVAMMGEWWASEINILVAGLLPDPRTSLAAMSLYQNINAMCFMLSVGASVAGGTRVGAALGAGDAAGARRAAFTCVAIGVGASSMCSLGLMLGRHAIVAVFTTDAELRRVLGGQLLPPLCVYIIGDAVQYCCGGVLQGCGRQRKAFPLVLASYYLVGLPLSFLLGFHQGWGVQGMVLGMLVGKLSHALAFSLLTLSTDWPREVEKAALRVGGEREAAAAASPPPRARTSSSTSTASALELRRADENLGERAQAATADDADGVDAPREMAAAHPTTAGAGSALGSASLRAAPPLVASKAARRYAKLDDES